MLTSNIVKQTVLQSNSLAYGTTDKIIVIIFSGAWCSWIIFIMLSVCSW